MGRTTIIIDDDLIKEAQRTTGLKTKREVVEQGLRELIRKINLEKLREDLGTFEIDLTPEELEKLREE